MDATVSNVLQAAVFVKITKALYAALIVVPCQLRFESKKVHRIIMTLDRDFNVTASNATVLILRSLNSNILPIVMHSLNCLIMTDDVNLCECTMANNPRHTFSCTEKRAFIPASAPFPLPSPFLESAYTNRCSCSHDDQTARPRVETDSTSQGIDNTPGLPRFRPLGH